MPLSREQMDANVGKMHSELQEYINRHGYTHVGVFGTLDDPIIGFVYTIGLTARGLPELIVSGLDRSSAMDIIAPVAKELIDRQDLFRMGVRDDLFNVRLELRDVTTLTTLDQYVCLAEACYPGQVRVIQVLWADASKHLPTEPGWNGDQFRQEILPARIPHS